jgi:hypothetical protein
MSTKRTKQQPTNMPSFDDKWFRLSVFGFLDAMTLPSLARTARCVHAHSVYELVRDKIISLKQLRHYPRCTLMLLGQHIKYVQIAQSDLLTLYNELLDDKGGLNPVGCAWIVCSVTGAHLNKPTTEVD